MHSFLWLSNIPLYICTTASLSVHLSVAGTHLCWALLHALQTLICLIVNQSYNVEITPACFTDGDAEVQEVEWLNPGCTAAGDRAGTGTQAVTEVCLNPPCHSAAFAGLHSVLWSYMEEFKFLWMTVIFLSYHYHIHIMSLPYSYYIIIIFTS